MALGGLIEGWGEGASLAGDVMAIQAPLFLHEAEDVGLQAFGIDAIESFNQPVEEIGTHGRRSQRRHFDAFYSVPTPYDKTNMSHPLSLVLIAFVVTAVPVLLLNKIIGKNLESLAVMGAAGVFHLGSIAVSGAELLKYAAAYGLICLIIGFSEEFFYRGYMTMRFEERLPRALELSFERQAHHLGGRDPLVDATEHLVASALETQIHDFQLPLAEHRQIAVALAQDIAGIGVNPDAPQLRKRPRQLVENHGQPRGGQHERLLVA